MAGTYWSAPKVSSEVFLGHHWGVAAVSLCFITFRTGVRLRYFKRIWIDDVLMIVAWLMLCATAALYQNQATDLYRHYPLVTGRVKPTSDHLAEERDLLRSLVAEYYLFYTTLWTVKVSILLFFRRIFGERQQAPWLKSWWWVVTCFTILTWAACLGTIPYRCLLRSLPWILGQCATQTKIDYVWVNLQLSCATDIITDVMILSIPVAALWNVQIPTRKKLGLLGILSLTFITIIFAIIRVAVMPNRRGTADITWLCLWAHVETGVAVIVACLASFRQLFVKSEQSNYRKQISDSYSSNQGSARAQNQSTRNTYFTTKAPFGLKALLPSSRSSPYASKSLPSQNSSIENSGTWGSILVNQDIDMTTKLYCDQVEKPLPKVYSSAFPSKVRYDVEEKAGV